MNERLPATHPELCREWSEKNEYPPEMFSYGSRDRVWWKCEKCGGEWQAKVSNRAINNTGCPFCNRGSKKVLPGYNDLMTRYPKTAAMWSEKNHPLKPGDFRYGSNYRAIWKCPKCGGEWEERIHTVVHKVHGCPYCTNKRLLKGYNDFASLYPEIAAEWSDRNLPLTPDSIFKTHQKTVWWKCPECGNDYQRLPYERIKGINCPYCAGTQAFPGFNDMATVYPELAAEMDPEKNIYRTPENTPATWDRYIWWKCPAGHSWRSRMKVRTEGGKTCPVCRMQFRRVLPLLLMIDAAEKSGLEAETDHDVNGEFTLEVYIPALRLAVEARGVSLEKRKEQQARNARCRELEITYLDFRSEKTDTGTAVKALKAYVKAGLTVPEITEEYITGLREKYDRASRMAFLEMKQTKGAEDE